jgi:hypothetical protein
MGISMFQTPSNLKSLRDHLSDHMELPEYFLGIHAVFDGEVIFARDVVQVNLELPPFPVDFANVWSWFREQLRGPSEQETFAYVLGFGVEDAEDPSMDKLLEITRGSSMTAWTFDLASQETANEGKRFLIVTVPDRQGARKFRDIYHGKELELASSPEAEDELLPR